MHRFRFLPVAALLAGCATAGVTTGTLSPSGELPLKRAPEPTTGAITAGDLMSRLYTFADDSMQGREAGTLGNVRGTNYVAREMARMGLQPGGENGTWFQTVPVMISRVDPASTFSVEGSPLVIWTDVAPQLGGAPARPLSGS